jgi:hypothetical protein
MTYAGMRGAQQIEAHGTARVDTAVETPVFNTFSID